MKTSQRHYISKKMFTWSRSSTLEARVIAFAKLLLMPRITCLWEGLIFREISRRRLLDSVLPKQELDHDIPWGRLAHRRMFVAGAKPLELCPAKKSITRPSTTVWSMSFMERRGSYMRIKETPEVSSYARLVAFGLVSSASFGWTRRSTEFELIASIFSQICKAMHCDLLRWSETFRNGSRWLYSNAQWVETVEFAWIEFRRIHAAELTLGQEYDGAFEIIHVSMFLWEEWYNPFEIIRVTVSFALRWATLLFLILQTGNILPSNIFCFSTWPIHTIGQGRILLVLAPRIAVYENMAVGPLTKMRARAIR